VTLCMSWENYIIFQEYIEYVVLSFTEVVGPAIILINGTHDFCERRKNTFNALPEYNIITRMS
jgi:hypothetical protein